MLPDMPLHPLVVHAAVVLIPVTALAVLASLVLPRFRAWLGWGLPVLGVVSAVTAFITVQLGEQLAEETTTTPVLATHFTWGARTEVFTALLGLMTIAWWGLTSPVVRARWGERTAVLDNRWLRLIVMVLSGVLALAAVVAVVLAGDSGATSVWG